MLATEHCTVEREIVPTRPVGIPGAVRILYAGSDLKAESLMMNLFEDHGIGLDVAPAGAAPQLAKKHKFHLMIVDDEQPADLIRQLRSAAANSKVAILAFAPTSHAGVAALRSGAVAVVHKPLRPADIARSIRAVSPMINLDRRSYFRSSLSAPVTIKRNGQDLMAKMVNVSRNGILVKGISVPKGEMLRLCFTLPSREGNLTVTAQGVWCDGHTLSGLQFLTFDGNGKSVLREWLDKQFVSLNREAGLLV